MNIPLDHKRASVTGGNYTASKAGLSMMTQTLAQEAAPFGVRMLALAPGTIQTPIHQNVGSDPASLKVLLETIPLNRTRKPEEIARLTVVLVSDVAAYAIGRTVIADGG